MNDKKNLFEFNLNYLEENVDKINEELRRAVGHLNKIENPVKIFDLENNDYYNAFILIGKIIFNFHASKIDFDLFLLKNFENFMITLLNYLLKVSKELNFNLKLDSSKAENAMTLNEKRVYILDYLLYLTNRLAENSQEFSEQFLLKNGVKAHFSLMNDEEFIEKSKNFTLTDLTGADWNLLDKMAMNITYLSTKTCDDHKKLWADLDAVKILLKIANYKQTTSFYAYMTISYVLDDRQIESLKVVRSIIELITNLLKQCSSQFEADCFDRKMRKINFKNKTLEYEVHRAKDSNGVFISITTLLYCLYKLAVSDKIKNILYLKHDIELCLKTFISKGNLIEIYYSLELLAQLTFSDSVTKDMIKIDNLMNILRDLYENKKKSFESQPENEIFQSIKNIIDQINWNLTEKHLRLVLNKVTDIKKDHVLISYNTVSRELCLKIKENLELCGYKVWIDVNDVHGFSLDSMTESVENSACMLICISERYRQSISSRSSAQYAYKLKKKIIPLVMQAEYQNVGGWLGNIIEQKNFIDFTQYDFEKCFQSLKLELKRILEIEIYTNDGKKFNSVEEWSKKDVHEWFLENDLSTVIFEHLKPSTGLILKEMFQMKQNASEFYYSSLKEIENIKFHEIVLFSSCLDRLFKLELCIK